MSASSSSSTISQPIPAILTKEIQDLYIRMNFTALKNYFAAQNQLVNFNFFELNIASAVSNASLAHNLGFAPKDIILTHATGPGVLQFLYNSFTATNIIYSTTGACRIRFFVGTYFMDTSTVQNQPTDIQTVGSYMLGAGS